MAQHLNGPRRRGRGAGSASAVSFVAQVAPPPGVRRLAKAVGLTQLLELQARSQQQTLRVVAAGAPAPWR